MVEAVSAGVEGTAKVVKAIADAPIVLPSDETLLMAEFVRDGADLQLVAPNGAVTAIEGYFDGGAPRDLMIAGAVVPGRVVGKLARAPRETEASAEGATASDPAAEQELQTADAAPRPADDTARYGAPIAEVSELSGTVQITRADGTVVTAAEGVLLFEDDVLATTADGAVGVTFVDGMTFSLSQGGRMVLDQFVYDAESQTGGGLFSVLQGKFSFVSGHAAHTAPDALMIETPSTTIGVRGTKVVAEIAADGSMTRIALLAEEDGRIGKIMVSTKAGQELISVPNRMVEVADSFAPPSAQKEVTSTELVDYFGSALEALPAPTTLFGQDPIEVDGGSRRKSDPVVEAADGGGGQPQAAVRSTVDIEIAGADRAELIDEDDADAVARPSATERIVAESEGDDDTVSVERADAEAVVVEEEVVEPSAEPGPVDISPADPAPAEPAPVDPMPVDPAPVVPAPVVPAPDDPIPVDPIPVVPAPVDPAPVDPAPVDPAPVDPAPVDPAPVDPAPVDSGPTDPAPVAPSVPDPVPANSAPVVSGTPGASLASLFEDAAAPSGTRVADVIADGAITDADGTAVEAIAITGADTTLGAWEYSLDSSASYQAVGSVSDPAALLLDADALLRFVPAPDANGAAELSFRAWDMTTGTVGERTDVSVHGGETAFSLATGTVSVAVTAVNDAPVVDAASTPVIAGVSEDASDPAWTTVADLLAQSPASDAEGDPLGIAVVGADDANGTWQISIAGGPAVALSGVSASNSVLLDETARVRFVPTAEFNGDATLTYRAWDQSAGTSGDTGVSTLAHGGATAFSAATVTATVSVAAVNDAPVLDTAGVPLLTSISENASDPAGTQVSDLLQGGVVTDADGPAAEGIALTFADTSNGVWEYSTDGAATYAPVNSVSETSALLLDGSAWVRFIPDASFNGAATIEYRAWDQTTGSNGESDVDVSVTGGSSAISAEAETATVLIGAVNDAPVLDITADPVLPVVQEDDAAPAGAAVSEWVSGLISDADGAAVDAIAVTGADTSGGTWEYSLNGTDYTAFGALDDSSATLLEGSALVRLVPNADFNGTASLTYRAWDQTTGTPGETGVDASVFGAATAFSAESETASVTVAAVNDAPVWNSGPASTMATVSEDSGATGWTPLGSLFSGDAITDADGAAVSAVAVVSAESAGGVWQYSFDDGATVQTIGTVGEAAAVLLDDTAVLRFVPNTDFNGTANLSFRAWDKSLGTLGQTGVDTTVNGGTTAFSTTIATTAVVVSSVNDAPVLDVTATPVLPTIQEDTPAPSGAAVSELVSGLVSDADGAAVEAIAVTGADTSGGVWEYSLNGTDYIAFGTLNDSTATLLDGSVLLRFVPNADFNGTASLTYRAWDQTTGTSGQSGVDASTNGADTAFSAEAETASVTVSAVNDAPVLDVTASPVLPTVAQDATAPAGTAVSSLVSGLVTDADGAAAEAIAVTGSDTTGGTWEYSLNGTDYFAFGALSDANATLLDGSALVRFVPNADFHGTATLTYRAWDQSAGSAGQTGVDASSFGADTAFSADAETASITVTDVNNSAPVFTSAASTLVAEDAVDATTVYIATTSDADTTGESVSYSLIDTASGLFEINSATGVVTLAPGQSLDYETNTSHVIMIRATDGVNPTDLEVTINVADVAETGGGAGTFDFTLGAAEVAVNSTTIGDQKAPSVAGLTGGGHVVVWHSDNQDGDKLGIYAQRYDATGAATGSEFLVNTRVTDDQQDPAVVGLADGGFVVVWQDNLVATSEDSIVAQRYDASGVAQGGEFQINSVFGDKQQDVSVSSLSDGGFVVAWTSQTTDPTGYGVQVRQFDATGAAVGDEQSVNITTADNQENPDVAGLAGGGYVVVWDSKGQDSDKEGVYARLYDAAGAAISGEIPVNSTETEAQQNAEVAALNDGGFVVAWTSKDQDTDGEGVFAQRFEADGTPTGAEFAVNTTTAHHQDEVEVIGLNDGGFLIAWTSMDQDGDGDGVYAQRYDASGVAQGGETLLNVTTADDQSAVSLAELSDGSLVAAWEEKAVGGVDEIVSRTFQANEAPVITAATGLDFNGTDGTVNAGDVYDASTGDLTVEAWFYWDGSNGTHSIVSKGASLTLEEGYQVTLSGGKLYITVQTAGTLADDVTSSVSLDMPADHGWYHVAMVIDQEAGVDASRVTGYLNGSTDGWVAGNGISIWNDTFTASDIDNDEPFRIGADTQFGNPQQQFDGGIDDVRVWDAARSQAEIQADMGRDLDGDEANLVGLFRLDETSGTFIDNAVSGAPDATLEGGATPLDTTSVTTAQDTAVGGRVSATDAEDHDLTYSVETGGDPTNGTAVIDADTGAWTYTPDAGFTGADTVSYQVTDALGGVDAITISVTVS